jgi:Leucine-rich repeat (LRR) protein
MSKPRSRWLQFNIRSLVALLTLVGALCGWIAYERGRNARGLNVLRGLEEKGASIGFYDDPAPRSEIVRAILGDNQADKVTFAHLSDPAITDDDLATLVYLPNTREVFIGATLQESKVSDKGLAHLQHLKDLRCLYINGAQMTDNSVAIIRRLSHLEELYLDRTAVTDVGLRHLSAIKVRHLSLADTRITDEGLETLASMPQLEVLNISGTQITDAGLRRLQEVKSLKEVYLTLTPVTDTGMDALLSALPSLVIKDRFRPRGSRVLSY